MIRLTVAVLLLLIPGLATAQAETRPTLTVAVQSVHSSLDPAVALANSGFPLSFNMFDTLIRRDFLSNEEATGNKFEPGLAESWEWVDETTLKLTLRDGLTFHNGEALTSEDVKFTFDRILDPDSQYVAARFQLGTIDHVEVVDQRVVTIATKQPDAMLIDMLAYVGSAIVPKDYFESVGFDGFGQKPVGAGPYRFTALMPDEEVRLAAFDDYWAGKPPASELTFRVMPEVSARITALANGEVDIINSVPPDQLTAIEGLDCCEVRSVLVNSHVLNYKTAHPVMADKTFRQALNLAIDRQLLSDALWNGEAAVLKGHQYSEWEELYNPQRSDFAYDPDQARQLLEKSSYDGEEIVFATHPVYYTNGQAEAQAVVEMWRKIGVNAKVRVDENWYGNSKSDPEIAVRNLSDWLIVADPNATILWSWSVTALWEGNEAFVTLGEAARSSLDPKVRFAKYQEMLDLFEEEAPGTVLFRTREYYGVRKAISWQPYTVYMMDFRAPNLSVE